MCCVLRSWSLQGCHPHLDDQTLLCSPASDTGGPILHEHTHVTKGQVCKSELLFVSEAEPMLDVGAGDAGQEMMELKDI